jgi:hypothetical protein
MTERTVTIKRYLSQETGVWAEIFIQDLPKDGMSVTAAHRKYEILFRTWLQCKLSLESQEGQTFVKISVGWKNDLM